VCEDEKDVLRHMNYLGAVMMRLWRSSREGQTDREGEREGGREGERERDRETETETATETETTENRERSKERHRDTDNKEAHTYKRARTHTRTEREREREREREERTRIAVPMISMTDTLQGACACGKTYAGQSDSSCRASSRTETSLSSAPSGNCAARRVS